jgi:hypothetical protein
MRSNVPWLAASLVFGLAAACSSSNQQTQPQTATQAQAPAPIPAGTEFTARLNEAIGSDSSTPGQFVTLTTISPLQDIAGVVVAPPGSKVRGRVVSVDRGAIPTIRLTFSNLETKDHGTLSLAATVKNPATGTPGATYSTEEIYSPSLAYNAVLLPPGPGRPSGPVGGGPTEQGATIHVPAGTAFRLVLTKPLTASTSEAAPSSSGK